MAVPPVPTITTTCNTIAESLFILASFISLIIVAAIGGVIIVLVKGKGGVDLANLPLDKIVIGIVSFAVIVVIAVLIVSSMCASA